MEYIEICGRRIGKKYPPLVIAEIGINHNGSLRVAKEMVDAAYRAGAEIIKHQTHIVDDEMSKEAKKVIPGNANVSIYDIMKKSALSFEDEKELKNLTISSKEIFSMRGGNKEELKEEQVTRNFAYATVVTIKPIRKVKNLLKKIFG